MMVAVVLFAVTSATGKWMVAKYPVGEFLAIRAGATLLMLVPLIWRAGTTAFRSAPRPGLQLLRIALSSAEVAMFFWAVGYMPLADATTFYLAAPIYVTVLSAIFLKEPVGWRRWSAVAVGFLGVLIALRPSAATLTWPALIALVGSLFFSIFLITTRMLRGTHDLVLTSGTFIGTLIVSATVAPFAWIAPRPADFVLMAVAGVVAMVAFFCINRALKLAPASVVVPYQYTMIVWAIVLGYLVFGDVPDGFMLTGAAIIVIAGLYILWREQIVARRDPSVEPVA